MSASLCELAREISMYVIVYVTYDDTSSLTRFDRCYLSEEISVEQSRRHRGPQEIQLPRSRLADTNGSACPVTTSNGSFAKASAPLSSAILVRD